TFGLVYLMTGGGPGGATRLYSILAYERAIVGLRFGPGAAVAFSMAPVLAIFILLLGLGFSAITTLLKSARPADQRSRPLLRRGQRENLGIVVRMLLLLPLLFF